MVVRDWRGICDLEAQLLLRILGLHVSYWAQLPCLFSRLNHGLPFQLAWGAPAEWEHATQLPTHSCSTIIQVVYTIVNNKAYKEDGCTRQACR